MADVQVTLETSETNTDPSIKLFQFRVCADGEAGGEWPEVFGSQSEAQAFARGLKAMASMLGRPDIQIPDPPVGF